MVRILGQNSKWKCLESTACDGNNECLIMNCLIKGEIPEPQEMATRTSKTDRKRGKAHTYPPAAGWLQGGPTHNNSTRKREGRKEKHWRA